MLINNLRCCSQRIDKLQKELARSHSAKNDDLLPYAARAYAAENCTFLQKSLFEEFNQFRYIESLIRHAKLAHNNDS